MADSLCQRASTAFRNVRQQEKARREAGLRCPRFVLVRWDSFTTLDASSSILPSHSVFVSAAPIRGYPGDCGDPHLDWEVFAGVPKILVKGVSIVGVTNGAMLGESSHAVHHAYRYRRSRILRDGRSGHRGLVSGDISSHSSVMRASDSAPCCRISPLKFVLQVIETVVRHTSIVLEHPDNNARM